MEALESRRGDIVRGRFELVRRRREVQADGTPFVIAQRAGERYSHPSDVRKMAAVECISGRGTERPSPHVSRGDGHNLVTVPDLEEKGPYASH
jgi:hypothetical protein